MERYDAVIVGAGFNGLYQLHRLRELGLSVHLFEADGGLGGVWQTNRYPGARVDSHVPNYEYSIESVWRDWNWSERFPGYQELRAYFEHVDQVLDLSRDISLNTRVNAASYADDTGEWAIVTTAGTVAAQFLIACTGFASKPYVPDLDGLESFAGPAHHSGHWPEEGVSFDGQRVGVLGTGASGVQIAQEAAAVADQLVIFQRSPVMALPMRQRKLTPADNAAAKAHYPDHFAKRNSPPGSFGDIMRLSVNALDASAEERERVFEEAWQAGGFHFWAGTFADIGLDRASNRTAYDFWRDKVRARIDDPVTAELLAPTDPPYPFGAKRPSLEQNYYDLFNQPNVELVDLLSEPIERVSATAVHTAKRELPLDVLALATGFDANTGGLTQMNITGRGGQQLGDRWADGVDTNLGISVHGFPNLLFLYGPQSPTAFCNGPTCAELQGDWIVELLDYMRSNGHQRLESTAQAEADWSAHLDELAAATLIGQTDSWYTAANIPGKRRQLLNYPSTDAYLDRLAATSAAGYDSFTFS